MLFRRPLIFACVESHEHARLQDSVFFNDRARALKQNDAGLARILADYSPAELAGVRQTAQDKPVGGLEKAPITIGAYAESDISDTICKKRVGLGLDSDGGLRHEGL